MKLDNFKVSISHNDGNSIDISDTILNINIIESIFGNLEGFIEVKDGVGLLDNVIDTQSIITLEFEYLSSSVKHSFYVDGVQSVDVSSSLTKKTYVINLKALDTLADSLKLVSKSFKGRGTDIIKSIFDQSFNSNLKVLDNSITHGHYIAPNVSPSVAIKQIQKQAYDINDSPFFLFQRLIDNKNSYLTSLSQIENQIPTASISPQIQNSDTVDREASNIGQPSNIVIHSTADNQVVKSAAGVYGKNIANLDISNSVVVNESFGVTTNSSSVVNLTRPDMFNDAKPLLNADDHIKICAMQTIINLLFSTNITAYNCQAIPNLGVGSKLEVNIMKNKLNQTQSGKFSGNYIVSKIVHRIEDNEYTQNIDMSKG